MHYNVEKMPEPPEEFYKLLTMNGKIALDVQSRTVEIGMLLAERDSVVDLLASGLLLYYLRENDKLTKQLAARDEELKRFNEALTPSDATWIAYRRMRGIVPWEDIQAIMDIIAERAVLQKGGAA